MPTILMTGTSGRVGSRLAQTLLDRGYDIIGVDPKMALPDLAAAKHYQHVCASGVELENNTAELAVLAGDEPITNLVCIGGGADGNDGGPNGLGVPTVDQTRKAVENNLLSCVGAAEAFVAVSDPTAQRTITFCGSINSSGAWTRPGYSMAKAGLETLTVYLAEVLGRKNIRVNMVAPGTIVDSAGIPALGGTDLTERLAQVTPLGRPATHDDIVLVFIAVMFDLPHVTGAILRVDGGQDIRRGFAPLQRLALPDVD